MVVEDELPLARSVQRRRGPNGWAKRSDTSDLRVAAREGGVVPRIHDWRFQLPGQHATNATKATLEA